jgi:hypothetical protein
MFPKYPVLDEFLGGLLGVLEGFIILIAILLILDPHFNQPEITTTSASASSACCGACTSSSSPRLIADILRHNVIPGILSVFGFLFPLDVRSTFAAVLLVRR